MHTFPAKNLQFRGSFSIITKNPEEVVLEEEKKKTVRFRIEDDWFSFYVGIILGLLVLFGIVKRVPW
jgi:hypothetical protein